MMYAGQAQEPIEIIVTPAEHSTPWMPIIGGALICPLIVAWLSAKWLRRKR